MKKLIWLSCILAISLSSQAQLQSPDEFLPHKIGEQVTPHYMLVDYAQHVAENSPHVLWSQYGWTNEKRPLQLLTIGSEENLARIEAIRTNNLRRAGVLEGKTDPALDDIAIVWLSYGVHGNEIAGPESAMPTLYHLANPDNADAQEWFKNAVILFDPSLNPDGYSRYTHWYRRVANKENDPSTFARSHSEPWPGGRANHYMFDLNRDWAWFTQHETQQRMPKFLDWLPHIHVDFHEQGVNSPYYFAPAARPYHEYMTQWQQDFQTTIGKNHAKHFDKNGWLYFTKEVFDLLYPSYGDTYPTYHGAIGMTYEQGGSGRAGRAVLMDNGDTLTLKDRVDHHFTAGLSSVEVSAKNAREIVQNFEKFYEDSRTNPPGDYKTFIIKGTNAPERIHAFTQLLDKNRIKYGKAGKARSLNAFNYQNGQTEKHNIEADDIIVSAFQPSGLFTQVLLDPNTYVEDSLTYDITAWSLPYAYGLEAYASKEKFQPSASYTAKTFEAVKATKAYAYVASWRSTQNARFLAALNKKGVRARYAIQAFQVDGKEHPAGSLVITQADNRKLGDKFHEILRRTASSFGQEMSAVTTGFVEKGKDFGSRNYAFIKEPKILLLSEEGTSSYSSGQAWYYFEQVLDYPVTLISPEQLSRIPLEQYNTLIMPEGRYRLNANTKESLNSWISGGGKLIAIGSAVGSLSGQDGFAVKRKAAPKKSDNKDGEDKRLLPFEGRQQRFASSNIPGAIFKVHLDKTHPLALGLGDTYFTLKTGTQSFDYLNNGGNVGVLKEDIYAQGFIGKQASERVKNTLVFGVQNKGRGSVVYLVDNPLFRGFWENGNFLFSNALFH